ncbi:hypothetical protein Dimus_034025, partial [Dionaea muscipula]
MKHRGRPPKNRNSRAPATKVVLNPLEQERELGLHNVRVEEEVEFGMVAVKGGAQDVKGIGQLRSALIAESKLVETSPYLKVVQQGSERKEEDSLKGAA